MSVGLPGTGVGGLFYLVSALWMPVRETCRALTGKSDVRSRSLVARQTLIALGVLGGIWLAGWLLGLMLTRVPAVTAVLNAAPALAGRSSNLLKITSLVLGLATLITVVGGVEILGAVRRWKPPREARPPAGEDRGLARPAA